MFHGDIFSNALFFEIGDLTAGGWNQIAGSSCCIYPGRLVTKKRIIGTFIFNFKLVPEMIYVLSLED